MHARNSPSRLGRGNRCTRDRLAYPSTPTGVTASWIAGTDALRDIWAVPVKIEYIDDPTTARAPSTWPDSPIPYTCRGHIAFTPHPTLDDARVRLPEYETLWAAIEEESISASAGRVVVGAITPATNRPRKPAHGR